MWKELAEQRASFVDGELQDLDEDFEPAPVTTITDVKFENDYFEVIGKAYTCGISRKYGGLTAKDGWLVAATNYGRFRFRRKSPSAGEAGSGSEDPLLPERRSRENNSSGAASRAEAAAPSAELLAVAKESLYKLCRVRECDSDLNDRLDAAITKAEAAASSRLQNQEEEKTDTRVDGKS